eukprot:TRINITY_DN2402_c0_g2_i7.p1 TRINITY_DN2402_c0_g2~~TRINITY_DN2402_c0_g2_i7.p1  ORF type:complete len:276 (+),score=42.33 TRINITY_DN2402_c0_g2_i7:350-1177(+)
METSTCPSPIEASSKEVLIWNSRKRFLRSTVDFCDWANANEKDCFPDELCSLSNLKSTLYPLCFKVSAGLRLLELINEGTAVSSSGGMICIHNITSGKCQRLNNDGCVRCLAVVSLNQSVTGSDDARIRVWNIDFGRCVKVLEGHSGSVDCICLSGDKLVVSGFNDGTLRVWDLYTGEELHSEGHNSGVSCVREIGDQRVVSASDDFVVRVWKVDSNFRELVCTLTGHQYRVTCVRSIGNSKIVSCSADRLRIWEITANPIRQVKLKHEEVRLCC